MEKSSLTVRLFHISTRGAMGHKCPIPFSAHVKMRLYDVRGFYAEASLYPFFKYDYMLKVRLHMHA